MEKKTQKKEEKLELIKADMNIGDIVRNHPETMDTFLRYGIHCFGCMAAQFETLEEGLMAHGMTNEEIDSFVDQLNEQIKEIKENKEELKENKK